MSEETWKDLLAYDEPKGFKPPHWCVVLFEVTIFLLAGIGAALLRFTDWSPLYQRTDLEEFCYYSSFMQPALSDDYTLIYYTISIALPFIMIIICEIERSYYSTNPKYKLFTGIQRFFYLSLRPLGMFILGIFLISIITDYIKVQVTWPRPYFLIENGEFCQNATIMRGTLTMKQRFGLTSFPCHLSSVSGFTAFLAACYAHTSVSLNAAPLIKPTIATGLFLITVSASIYRVEIHYNHYIDVLFGLGIGAFFAFIVNSVLLQGHKSRTKVMAETACKLLLPRVALPRSTSHNGNLNGGTATIHTIRSHTSQQSKGGRPFSEA